MPQEKNMSNTQLKPKQFLQDYLIFVILAVMVLGMAFMSPNFLTVNNLLNLLNQSAIFGILALGIFMVLVSKGIDLSVGAVLAFAGITAGTISQTVDAANRIFPGAPMSPLWMTIVVALVVGAGIGAINGALIAYTGIPPFIATLGSQIAFRGGALMITQGRPVSNINPDIHVFGRPFMGVPMPIMLWVVCAVVIYVLMNHTAFGKSVYAIGGNVEAAEISGIKVKKTLTWVYAISGILSGLAALIFIGRTGGSIHPAAGTMFETTAIAAATIGGTSHGGGIGKVQGVVIGTLILGTLTNGFTLLGIDVYVQQIAQGLIIVLAVIIDMRKNKKR